jgi:hypothetical protein
MRTIQLHVPSVLIGLTAAALVLVSMGQLAPPAEPVRVEPAHVESAPRASDMVQIREGSAFVVPDGRTFVLTGLGTTSTLGLATLRVNGQEEVTAGGVAATAGFATIVSIPPVPVGFTVGAGVRIEVDDGTTGTNRGRAWGYLTKD